MLRWRELEIRSNMTAQLVLHKQVLPPDPDVLTRVTIGIYATGLVHNNNGTARFKKCKQLFE
jgi:hypothetical protein